MTGIKNIDHEELRNIFKDIVLTHCYSKAVLAEGTNANTFKTTGTVYYSIDGAMYTKAATDNLTFTAAAQQPISTYCKYLICLDASANASSVKGVEAATAAEAMVPDPTSGTCPIGYVQVATDGTHTFTAGSVDLSAAGITATFVDLAQLPSASQVD